ncbi:MAG: excinuclease ABC subunit A [Deltaproteobacteria bacterium HGW-Deltaproteobacteria-17]|nr:MAG: excinuclease ABC subunit A [Deltaproteobacteria bacterium HGW-Deltaproteobacteria-17]
MKTSLGDNTSCIRIVGARQHNLKNISLDLPHRRLVVICGPSGSGKSTLAFDIIYAEGQRRYVESLSAYARQFLPQLDKPQVERIEGLSPAISIDQQNSSHNPRSTVGTVTEIHDFLRVFFSRLGTARCIYCRTPLVTQTREELTDRLIASDHGRMVYLLAPLARQLKGTHVELLEKCRREGFSRARIDGAILELDPLPQLKKTFKHDIDLVIDRFDPGRVSRSRVSGSIELALRWGQETFVVSDPSGNERLVSTQARCLTHDFSAPSLSPQLFSFNSPLGYCSTCYGLGTVSFLSPRLIAPNPQLSLQQRAIAPLPENWWTRLKESFGQVMKRYNFTTGTPLGELSEEAAGVLFHGDQKLGWSGVITLLEHSARYGGAFAESLSGYKETRPCPACGGGRLNPVASAVVVRDKSLVDVENLPAEAALEWFSNLRFSETEAPVGDPLVEEITHRLRFLCEVGLGYIHLNRTVYTLSGGESQRIRLAGQLGSGLVGVTYVLDEPSVGLHPQDHQRLLGTLMHLRDRGNSVIVVEHDPGTIHAADHVVELGPGSGRYGGELSFEGPVAGLMKADTLTARYLRGERFGVDRVQRPAPRSFIRLHGVTTHNLKNVDFSMPLGRLVCVTGVSGSGKSSLVVDTLYKHLALRLGLGVENPGQLAGIENAESVTRVVLIDQSPIGRTPRSNPATYTKIFDEIRGIFAGLPESQVRGWAPGRFSFNVRGGRCDKCDGDGQIRIEMHFLPDVFITCEACGGLRYNQSTLEVTFKGRNIAQVLQMTVAEAMDVFSAHPSLMRKLKVLSDVGLDYLQLGQSATTLSGGEAQRLKISRELGKRDLPGTVYILDEPTTGLHMQEVGMLIQVLHQLVERQATVLLIEHNLEVIASADHVVDLGPAGGAAGGHILAVGSPAEIMANPDSITGRWLADREAQQ